MLETKQQKSTFFTAIALVVILSVVSLWNRGGGVPIDNTSRVSENRFDYAAYLAALNVDPVASRELFEQIISEEEVKRQAEQMLSIDQPVRPAIVSDSQLKITNRTGQSVVLDYFREDNAILSSYRDLTKGQVESLFDFSLSLSETESVMGKLTRSLEGIYALSVPQEVLGFHKAQLASLEAYRKLVSESQRIAVNSYDQPWPKLYHEYAVINEQMAVMNSEFAKLDQKYSINDVLTSELAVGGGKESLFIKTAHAQFAVVDVKQLATEIFYEALAAAYARFALALFDKVITTIETNYKIANFLYYTDAVASGQYVQDYLDKYVNNNTDKNMIRNFIPSLNCGNPQNVRIALQAKANQYLGFDPSTLRVDDPQYFQKMSRVGNFLSSPTGWKVFYEELALEAQSEADKATELELLSQGIKSARDAYNKGQIATSGMTVLTTYRSAFQSYLDVGSSNSKSAVSKIVSAVVQTFLNSHVFKGAVLKEQSVCIAAAQITPILPNINVVPEPTPPPPDNTVR